MFRHRLAPEADYYRLPVPPAPAFCPANYLLCPLAVIPGFACPWLIRFS